MKRWKRKHDLNQIKSILYSLKENEYYRKLFKLLLEFYYPQIPKDQKHYIFSSHNAVLIDDHFYNSEIVMVHYDDIVMRMTQQLQQSKTKAKKL